MEESFFKWEKELLDSLVQLIYQKLDQVHKV